MDILLLIGLVCFGYLWAGKVDFIEDFKSLIGFGENLEYKPKNKVLKYIVDFIHKQFNCYCVIFWITWIITGNIWLGFITYVGADFLTQLIDYLRSNIKY